MPTFKTEVLLLVSNVLLVKGQNEWQVQHYLALKQQQLMTCFATKAKPISYIDRQCHYKQTEK